MLKSMQSTTSLTKESGQNVPPKEEDTLDLLRKRISKSKNGGNLPEIARKELQ